MPTSRSFVGLETGLLLFLSSEREKKKMGGGKKGRRRHPRGVCEKQGEGWIRTQERGEKSASCRQNMIDANRQTISVSKMVCVFRRRY